ncbi:MAG: C10 family peptidase [Bacteroidota bacterium]
MKNVILFLFAAISCQLFVRVDTMAQHVSRQEAITVAGNYIKNRQLKLEIIQTETLMSGIDSIAWLMHCEPRGFMVIASGKMQPPVLAWSDECNFGEGQAGDIFLPIFLFDLKTRNAFSVPETSEARANLQKWTYWLNPDQHCRVFEQWPTAGWSPTGGWLFTNWTQTSPYNALCPIDGQTHVRSVAGCPATAMAQIINFQHNIHQTRFTDADDYYHNYGSGNMYWIDDDWDSHGFPSWDQLNLYLDTLEGRYQSSLPLSNTDKAALTFACGAAAKQVYSSSVSGTYGINQAYDAFIRFGYSDARLVDPSNPGLNNQLAQNMMLALPAQLGLVNEAWTVGHNVVVDGYNTDELFHFNFGWGGSANGWYTMPPVDIPYDLTVIEGVVMDINLSNPPVGANHANPAENITAMAYISETGMLRISLPETITNARVCIYDASGRMRICEPVACSGGLGITDLQLPGLVPGLYVACLEAGNNVAYRSKFIVKS